MNLDLRGDNTLLLASGGSDTGAVHTTYSGR